MTQQISKLCTEELFTKKNGAKNGLWQNCCRSLFPKNNFWLSLFCFWLIILNAVLLDFQYLSICNITNSYKFAQQDKNAKVGSKFGRVLIKTWKLLWTWNFLKMSFPRWKFKSLSWNPSQETRLNQFKSLQSCKFLCDHSQQHFSNMPPSPFCSKQPLR